jgi:aminoglycoside N3'-acetyltransferase
MVLKLNRNEQRHQNCPVDISSLVHNLLNVRSCTLILVACLLVFFWLEGGRGGVVGTYENDLFTFNMLSLGTRS